MSLLHGPDHAGLPDQYDRPLTADDDRSDIDVGAGVGEAARRRLLDPNGRPFVRRVDGHDLIDLRTRRGRPLVGPLPLPRNGRRPDVDVDADVDVDVGPPTTPEPSAAQPNGEPPAAIDPSGTPTDGRPSTDDGGAAAAGDADESDRVTAPGVDDGEPRRTHARRARLPHALRIRAIRLTSFVPLALAAWAVLGAALLGTSVVVWNAVLRLGYVEAIEDGASSALGAEEFTLVGANLFPAAAAVAAAVAAIGFLVTFLLAVVYNAVSLLLGGLALDIGPSRRGRRVSPPDTVGS